MLNIVVLKSEPCCYQIIEHKGDFQGTKPKPHYKSIPLAILKHTKNKPLSHEIPEDQCVILSFLPRLADAGLPLLTLTGIFSAKMAAEGWGGASLGTVLTGKPEDLSSNPQNLSKTWVWQYVCVSWCSYCKMRAKTGESGDPQGPAYTATTTNRSSLKQGGRRRHISVHMFIRSHV